MSNDLTESEILSMMELCENKHGKVTTKLFTEDDELCHPYYVTKAFDTFSEAKLKANLDNVGQIHLTKDELDRINKSITDRQKEIIIGLLMGDAWIAKDENKNAKLSVEMINKDFLEYVNTELGDIVSICRLKSTAKELADKNRKYGYTVNESKYNDIYTLRTRSLEYFNELHQWYSSGKKRFPKDLELTPLIVKVWYCCDGSYCDNSYPVIYSSNESDNREMVLDLFKNTQIDPSYIDSGGGAINFKRSGSDDFFNYIGDPLPGFEYKWPEEFK